ARASGGLDHLVSHRGLGGFARPARLFTLKLALALKFKPLRLALLTCSLLVGRGPFSGSFLVGDRLLAGGFGGNFLRIGFAFRRCSSSRRLGALGLQYLFGAVAVEQRVIFGADHIGLDQNCALLVSK